MRFGPKPGWMMMPSPSAATGQKVDIEIAMMGRLIPEESLVYDFSHDEEGLGLIMPVVRIERVEYLLVR